MAVDIIVTGDKRLDATIKTLKESGQKRIGRAAVSSGMTLLRKTIQRAAPVGPTGNLKRAIGKRFKRLKSEGITVGKVGINVGSRAKEVKALAAAGITVRTSGRSKFMRELQRASIASGKLAPHGYLVALGTRQRFATTRGGVPLTTPASRGTMPANDFVKRATENSRGAVQQKMLSKIRERLPIELAKAKAGQK